MILQTNLYDEFVQYLDKTKPVFYKTGVKEGEFLRAIYIELHGTSLGNIEMVFRAVKLQFCDENPKGAIEYLIQRFAAPLNATQTEVEVKLA